jgi:ubiquinone/menaquinone biosynthesis C-methylase UbiE
MKDVKSTKWEESYGRMENFIFYPQAEVIKFINRFVKKKIGADKFKDILNPDQPLSALDFGCGIGRNVLLFEEFNIKGYGIDISSNAIATAKQLAEHAYPDNKELLDRFITTDGLTLPYGDNFFDFAVSDSVLDSMYFDIAKTLVTELDRTVKKYLFITVIADPININGEGKEIVVDSNHENGTIQSFFTMEKIVRLIEGTNWKKKWASLIREEQITNNVVNARFFVVLEK